MIRIKICGITNLEDALQAVELGVDALGFVFAESPRTIKEEKAKAICRKVPPFISKVGVFVNFSPGEVKRIVEYCGLDVIQLHGEESADYCKNFSSYKVVKSIRIKDISSLDMLPQYSEVNAYLLDTYVDGCKGGTGKTFNWEIACQANKYKVPLILSGGLTPENVICAIGKVKPYAVDVSSGVEKEPGKKDFEKMEEFIKNVTG